MPKIAMMRPRCVSVAEWFTHASPAIHRKLAALARHQAQAQQTLLNISHLVESRILAGEAAPVDLSRTHGHMRAALGRLLDVAHERHTLEDALKVYGLYDQLVKALREAREAAGQDPDFRRKAQ